MAGGTPKESNSKFNDTSQNLRTVDGVIEALRIHREKAANARKFYQSSQLRAKYAFKNRKVMSGKEHVSTLTLSIDFAQATDVPNYCDQVGQLYFISPLTVGLFDMSDEGAEEQATYLMPETRSFKKNGNTVASLVLDFLKKRNCTFDELIVFADNTCSQCKNKYFITALSMTAGEKVYGCKSIRLSFLIVGHTKF